MPFNVPNVQLLRDANISLIVMTLKSLPAMKGVAYLSPLRFAGALCTLQVSYIKV